MQFQSAVKSKAKARIALIGPSGSGKTYTALAVGSRLAELAGGKLAVIDTERNSASLYADLFKFDTLDLDNHNPAQYIEAIKAAEAGGYKVLVIDSLSHAWMGRDGALELVDKAAARSQGNSFAAWRNVTPLHNKLVDAILTSPCHVLCTLRAKTEYSQEKDDRGKTVIRKVGLAPIMRDGIEYEFTVAADVDMDHRAIVTKSRCPIVADAVVDKPGAQFAETLWGWLNSGPDVAFKPAETTEAPAPVAEPVSFPPLAPATVTTNEQPKPINGNIVKVWVDGLVREYSNGDDAKGKRVRERVKALWDENTTVAITDMTDAELQAAINTITNIIKEKVHAAQ